MLIERFQVWEKNKLSARKDEILVSLKQRPYRTASKGSLKLRDRGKKEKEKL